MTGFSCLGDCLAQDVDALAFEPLQMGEPVALADAATRSVRSLDTQHHANSFVLSECGGFEGRALLRLAAVRQMQAAFLFRFLLPPPAAGAFRLADATARVQGAQPIEGKPRSCSTLYGTAWSRT